MAKMSKRKSYLDLCFGRGLESFTSTTSVTMMEVMRHYVFIKNNTTKGNDCDARIKVTENLKKHFLSVNPTKTILLSDKTIRDKLKKNWDKRQKFIKNPKLYQKSIIDFRSACRLEFMDLSICKCSNKKFCNHNRETNRKGVKTKTIGLSVEKSTPLLDSDTDSELDVVSKNYDEDYGDNSRTPKLNLSVLSELADRFNISDRACAGIASGLLTDMGKIDETNKESVIDRNKVRRARCKKRKSEEMKLTFNGTALFFDGRKDDTLKTLEINGTIYFIFIFQFTIKILYSGAKKIEKKKEEHIVLVQEPGSKYVGHITPKSGKAEKISEAIKDYFDDDVWEQIDCIGSDGTAVNTGITLHV